MSRGGIIVEKWARPRPVSTKVSVHAGAVFAGANLLPFQELPKVLQDTAVVTKEMAPLFGICRVLVTLTSSVSCQDAGDLMELHHIHNYSLVAAKAGTKCHFSGLCSCSSEGGSRMRVVKFT